MFYFSLTRLPIRVILAIQRFNWKILLYLYIIINRLSRKELDFIYRLIAVPKVLFALGVKVNDRPIKYFFGEACHDLSLRERAKRSTRHSAEQGCLSGTGLGRTANCGKAQKSS